MEPPAHRTESREDQITMQTHNAHNFTHGAPINTGKLLRQNDRPLTLDQIRRSAPSVFAVEAHESRSDRYVYIPTSNILEGLMRNGFQPFAVMQARTRDAERGDFTKHMVKLRHVNSTALRFVGDTYLELTLVNSHDGTSAYRINGGMFRLACSNGLVIADSFQASVSVMHKGNIQHEVIEGSTRVLEQSAKAGAVAGEWNGLMLTNGEALEMATLAQRLRWGKEEDGHVVIAPAAPQPTALLNAKRSSDAGNNLWNVFNRLQENVIRGGQRVTYRDKGKFHHRTARPVNGIDQDLKLNKNLWTLAEAMAAIKQGREVAATA
jgi:hypothetical protein